MPTLLPPGPAARLGTAIHKLLEEAGKGAFSGSPGNATADSRWTELVAEAEAKMAATPRERRFVPMERSVRNYEVLRIQALSRAAELSSAFTPHKNAGPKDNKRYGFELDVSSSDGLLAGSIDRATGGAEGVNLLDYKSGAIFSLADDGQEQLKPEYITQLRLYAAMYYETNGVWPTKLQLMPLRGDPLEVPFSPEECLEALGQARAMLESANHCIREFEDRPDELEEALARPSPKACGYCSYRPACSAYLSRDCVGGDRAWPTDVWGRLVGTTRLGNGSLMLRIEDAQGCVVMLRGLPDSLFEGQRSPLTLSHGTPIGVFNAKPTASPKAFEPRQWTVIVYPEADPVA